MTAPLLVFGWGNPSRGDDALGPLFVERLRERCAELGAQAAGRVDFLDDYQLQVEHALDLVGRERVLFVDASLGCAAPFEATPVAAAARPHASPRTRCRRRRCCRSTARCSGSEPPPCTLLAIRGERFELGEPPSEAALRNLEAALDWALGWVR